MSRIVLDGISKSYSGIPAVRDFNLIVDERKFLTLLGPSGCGKTTTLRLIAGLEEPDAGEISIGDRVLYSREKGVFVPPEKRGLGLIFQSYALWPHMTVRKNISLALEQKRLPKAEIRKKVGEVLEKVQLAEYVDRFPSELSGGQQQRVAVARMIAAEPVIFLMDEPLSNLDAMLRVDMRAELKHLHHELEATTVYVTHDQVEALTLSDRIAVMDRGELRQVGTPEEIYKKPEDLFVARFVGSPRINTLEGRLISVNGRTHFQSGQLEVILDRPPRQGSGKVIATVRPEDISISKEKKDGWPRLCVYSVLPAGSETIIAVQRDDLSLTVKVNGFTDIRMDDNVWIDLSAESINFYNPETEALLTPE
ncbi:MAG: ABC transporter ATP-binding protein [Spirochaetia bacterium]